MDYRDYQNARDAAWRILLDCKIDCLPVDLNAICRKLKIRVLAYGKNLGMIERAELVPLVRHADGVTFYAQDMPIVLFDEAKPQPRARFTVAHELGHIVLGHVRPGSVTAANREPQPGDSPEETAANQFAARLLAPACVLWGLGVHTPEEIMELCWISRPAAEFRAQRMAELYRRDKFLTSAIERKVYRQFQPFMESRHSHRG